MNKFRLPKDTIKSLKYKQPSIYENKITNFILNQFNKIRNLSNIFLIFSLLVI